MAAVAVMGAFGGGYSRKDSGLRWIGAVRAAMVVRLHVDSLLRRCFDVFAAP